MPESAFDGPTSPHAGERTTESPTPPRASERMLDRPTLVLPQADKRLIDLPPWA